MNVRTLAPAGLLAALIVLAVILSTPYAGRAAFPGSNGYILFHSDRDGDEQIFRIMPDGSDELPLTEDGRNFSGAWSPDGTRIAFVSDRDGGSGEIYVMNSDGSNETRLTTNSLQDSAPNWSADGNSIVFLRRDESGNDIKIWTVPATGGTAVVLIDSPGTDTMPVFSPDGTRIAYSHNDVGENDIELYVANADGTNPQPLTNNTTPDGWPDWSPDSTHIAYACNDGDGEICVIDAGGGTPQNLTSNTGDFEGYPAWSPDGTRIAFEGYPNNAAIGGIYTMDTAGGDVQPVTVNNDYEPDWQSSSNPTATPTATSSSPPTPTASPTPGVTSPGQTPSPTVTVTPTPSGGAQLLWGDADCDGAVSSRDNQALLRNVLQQSPLSQTEPCPDLGETVDGRVWGDWDCDGAISSRDNQALLRAVLGQAALSQTEPCPDIGSAA